MDAPREPPECFMEPSYHRGHKSDGLAVSPLLPAKLADALHVPEDVGAAHCHQNDGGAWLRQLQSVPSTLGPK